MMLLLVLLPVVFAQQQREGTNERLVFETINGVTRANYDAKHMQEIVYPNIHTTEDDTYACITAPVPGTSKIIRIQTEVNSESVDSVVVYGCRDTPVVTEGTWRCPGKVKDDICAGKFEVVQAWSRNLTSQVKRPFTFEPVEVGGEGEVRHLVVRTRFRYPVFDDETGVIITYQMLSSTLPTGQFTDSMFGEDYMARLALEAEELERDHRPRLQNLQKILDGVVGVVQVTPWPIRRLNIGQPAGISLDSLKNPWIFHRAGRVWDEDTFNDENVYTGDRTRPITEEPVLKVDKDTGEVVRGLGSDIFFMPHGISMDYADDIYVTDVALHQVFKLDGETGQVLLTLGQPFVPGKDAGHFCKPTDVAVDPRNGDIFVADGYCNSRILKYDSDGNLLSIWGSDADGDVLNFDIVHSITYVDRWTAVCAADRERGQIKCFDADSGQLVAIIEDESMRRVFAISYDPDNSRMYVVNGYTDGGYTHGLTFEIGLTFRKIDEWGPDEGTTIMPHDVAAAGDDIYVADVIGRRVYKFFDESSAV